MPILAFTTAGLSCCLHVVQAKSHSQIRRSRVVVVDSNLSLNKGSIFERPLVLARRLDFVYYWMIAFHCGT